MIKRTLEISRESAHLSVRYKQLVLKREGQVVASVPCEDIGVVVIDHPQTTYTHSALALLAESDAAVWLSDVSDEELNNEPFRRDPALVGLNGFLNYGYAIIRASIARSVVAAGLQPSLGIHHRNRSNAFCLADDLIEPFRPLVDDRVREMYRQGYDELNQPAKAELLNVLSQPMQLGEQAGPLMVMFSRLIASLVRCYTGDAKKLEIPTVCSS